MNCCMVTLTLKSFSWYRRGSVYVQINCNLIRQPEIAPFRERADIKGNHDAPMWWIQTGHLKFPINVPKKFCASTGDRTPRSTVYQGEGQNRKTPRTPHRWHILIHHFYSTHTGHTQNKISVSVCVPRVMQYSHYRSPTKLRQGNVFTSCTVVLFTGGASPFWTMDRDPTGQRSPSPRPPTQRPPTQKPPWQKPPWKETPYTETLWYTTILQYT